MEIETLILQFCNIQKQKCKTNKDKSEFFGSDFLSGSADQDGIQK